LGRYKSDIPDELQRTVSKLLEKDPSMRYQVAAGVTSDLKRLIAPTQSTISVSPIKERSRWPLWAGMGVVACVLVAVLGWRFLRTDQELLGPEGRKMLAVLPFENLGDPNDEYFADGLTEEITSKLGVVGGLGVISRTSAMLYKNTDKGLPEIAGELGVDFIIEGTVRWDKIGDTSVVRITPQLIRVSDNTHLWADNYERPLTSIFSIQADIAERIVEKLGVTLLESARRLIEDQPTENMQAYEYLLRGHEYRLRTFKEDDCRIAFEMYQKAVELDSTFAEAYAWLGYSHLALYWWLHDGTSSRLEKARVAIDRALELEPDLPEGHSTLAGYYYWGFLDYENALKEMARVREIRPLNSWDYNGLGAVNRRQGNWEEALLSFERSVELSPRNGMYFLELALTHHTMRHFEEAERFYEISISLTPELTWAYTIASDMYISLHGDVSAARKVLNSAKGKVDSIALIYSWVECDIADRDYQSALNRLTNVINPHGYDISDYYLTKAFCYQLVDDSSTSTAFYDSARTYLENRDQPISLGQEYLDVNLATAYAGLGMKEKAISEMNKAAARLPLSKDAFDGTTIMHLNAITNVLIGEYESALDLIDTLLSVPSPLSVPGLRLHPQWDPLRDHPRFQALLKKYEKEHGN